ncbi:hypothetical protein [Candidatus Spongiihabitans sp.]|uniref:hypothetical protein n=1 Tax=Candidatus Spongiihabitans sp. TaxID=3101308 RepID=UPI003C6F1165
MSTLDNLVNIPAPAFAETASKDVVDSTLIKHATKRKTKHETIKIVGDIPVDLDVHDGSKFLFISKDQKSFTHNIHKYPAPTV